MKGKEERVVEFREVNWKMAIERREVERKEGRGEVEGRGGDKGGEEKGV